ncbi:MAG: alpha/beta fold hydrolase [Myxococcota bacterium]
MQLIHPDGTALGASLHRGTRDDWVVIAGATAVPHRYYDALAEWLSNALGVNVLSFDYRGIGASRSGPLRGMSADYRDWASDLALAIDHAADRGPTVVVGHSFGGHAFGMTDAHTRTRGLYTFATGAGWHGWMSWPESVRVRFLWDVLGPVLVGWHGYLPFSKVGMGEDLPLGVYSDWRKWCRNPHYFFEDPEADFEERFQRVRVPVVGVNSTDDAWAPPSSAAAFLSHYPGSRCLVVSPRSIGRESIGHMAYVRPSCRGLWDDLGRFVEARLAEGQDRLERAG